MGRHREAPISVRLTDMLEEIDKRRGTTGESRHALIRRLIRFALDKMPDAKPERKSS